MQALRSVWNLRPTIVPRVAHFGYAYVDVNENCLSPVLGNIVCQNDTALNLSALWIQFLQMVQPGFFKSIGNGEYIKTIYDPAENTVFAVELTPFPDQGCADTVYSRIHYSTEKPSILK
jgi:hypothetical protein